MTAGADATQWISSGLPFGFDGANDTSWQTLTHCVTLPAGQTGPVRVTFVATMPPGIAMGAARIFIDDITFEQVASCS